MLDRLSFILGEAMIALRRNGFMTFAAISTVAVSLYLLGGMVYVYARATDYANTLPGKFEMRVFLKEGTTFNEIKQTAFDIRALPGVGEVSWIPRDKAWEKEKRENPALTTGIENPYPDAFKVTIKDLKLGDAIAAKVRALNTVSPEEGVSYLSDEQHLIEQLLQALRWLGSVLGGLLFVTAGVLIYNAIQLTVLSRRMEIRIMQLVGASRLVVRVPFLIEGFIQGTLGGLLAATMLLASQRVLQSKLLQINPDFHIAAFPIGQASLLLALVGGGYGLLCSFIGLTRAQLNFR